jgi:hypothetical protein
MEIKLPVDIVNEIFNLLNDIKDVVHFCLTSKYYYLALQEEKIKRIKLLESNKIIRSKTSITNYTNYGCELNTNWTAFNIFFTFQE